MTIQHKVKAQEVKTGCDSTAERRKSLATAEGRGLVSQARKPQSGGRFFRRAALLAVYGFASKM